jgi:hypothetical protein
MSHCSREPAVEIFNMYLLYCIRFQIRLFGIETSFERRRYCREALKDFKILRHLILILGSEQAVSKNAGHKNVHCELCWNFRTIYGGSEMSRNRVVIPARQAT